jgi:hypothetical protein
MLAPPAILPKLRPMPVSVQPAIREDLQIDIFRRMTPGKKLELAVAMQQQARALMEAGLKQSHPHLTADERRREIARRFLHART